MIFLSVVSNFVRCIIIEIEHGKRLAVFAIPGFRGSLRCPSVFSLDKKKLNGILNKANKITKGKSYSVLLELAHKILKVD